jgi:hypothetical protein
MIPKEPLTATPMASMYGFIKFDQAGIGILAIIKKIEPLITAGRVNTSPLRMETRYLLFPALASGGIRTFCNQSINLFMKNLLLYILVTKTV